MMRIAKLLEWSMSSCARACPFKVEFRSKSVRTATRAFYGGAVVAMAQVMRNPGTW